MNKYKIKIIGKNPDYFLNLLISKKIHFTNVEKNRKILTLILDEENYNKAISLKTSYKVELLNTYGTIKYKLFFKKNMIFIFGIILFFLLINIISNFIFNIRIIHEDKTIIELINSELNKNDIAIFNIKKNKEELDIIIEKIINNNKDKIEWMEIKESGVTYIVEVQERKIKEENEDCLPQSIIAKKDSRIISITAESGEIIKKKNDYVKTGDIIISGLIYNNEKIMEKKCAIGTVYAEVWYNIEVEIPKNYETVTKTNKDNFGIELQILNKTYSLIGGYKDYESIKTPLISAKILPIFISFSNFFEIKRENHQYNYYNIDDKSLEIAEEKLFATLSEDSEVISKSVIKKEEKDSKIIVDVFFKVKENITDTISLDDINIEETNDELREE